MDGKIRQSFTFPETLAVNKKKLSKKSYFVKRQAELVAASNMKTIRIVLDSEINSE